MEKNNSVIVDGVVMTESEFAELQKNPKIKLKEISPNTYTKLEKMCG